MTTVPGPRPANDLMLRLSVSMPQARTAKDRVLRGQPDRLLGRRFRLPDSDLQLMVLSYDNHLVKLVPYERGPKRTTKFIYNTVEWALFEVLLNEVLEEC